MAVDFDILAQKGPSDDVYAVRDPIDGLWIGTPDHVSLYRDKVLGGHLHSALTRAKCVAVVMSVQLGRQFEYALYDGGAWRDTIMTTDGKHGVRFI